MKYEGTEAGRLVTILCERERVSPGSQAPSWSAASQTYIMLLEAQRHEPPKQKQAGTTMQDDNTGDNSGYMTGQFLVAMPNMPDERFEKSVIFICAHNADGAMGLVINKLIPKVAFSELLNQLDMELPPSSPNVQVHFGGPVETGRGFVLHSNDYNHEGTLPIDDEVNLTATIDILRAIATGHGPRQCLLALGYAGWAPGQLDAELQANGWLTIPADNAIIFDPDNETKWERAIAKLGITPSMLSMDAGHA